MFIVLPIIFFNYVLHYTVVFLTFFVFILKDFLFLIEIFNSNFPMVICKILHLVDDWKERSYYAFFSDSFLVNIIFKK